MDQAKKGEAALSSSNYEEAIRHFTDAININPTAVKYYIHRSTAYQRAARYPEALHDAELAVVLATKRGSRELIKDAQFRRGLALFFLGQYANAQFVLAIVKELDEKNKMLPIWTMKVEAKLKDIPADDEGRKVTVQKVPDVEIPSPAAASKSTLSNSKPAGGEATSQTPKPVLPTPADKIKVDWYQNNETVTINILAKGVPKEAASVELEKDSMHVSFPITGSSSDYTFAADPLYSSIDAEKSKYRITPNKLEITLHKAAPGSKWHQLEDASRVNLDLGSGEKAPNKTTIPSHVLTAKSDSAPAYPTSSKSGAKNWDKVAAEDLDDKDEIEGDETSHFFKKLYKDATPEQQKAMMKSYQESGGTVLSTDWSNVGSRTVAPEPPDGMEAKKYSV